MPRPLILRGLCSGATEPAQQLELESPRRCCHSRRVSIDLWPRSGWWPHWPFSGFIPRFLHSLPQDNERDNTLCAIGPPLHLARRAAIMESKWRATDAKTWRPEATLRQGKGRLRERANVGVRARRRRDNHGQAANIRLWRPGNEIATWSCSPRIRSAESVQLVGEGIIIHFSS